MRRILITGASGNVGRELIQQLLQRSTSVQILAGQRDPASYQAPVPAAAVEAIAFDFGNPATFTAALKGCDALFLLRPPQLADAKKYFAPLIKAAQMQAIKQVVFLSVQGAEDNSRIPHYAIEQLIIQSGLPYSFLRPAYFMQNFSTTLRKDIVEKDEIFLPAGKAPFSLIDVVDLAKFASQVLLNPEDHQFKAYTLTNGELLHFGEMAAILSKVLGRKIRYLSPNLVNFYWRKRKEKISSTYILVMIMLHYLPRFKPAPPAPSTLEEVTGEKASSFHDFVENNQLLFKAQ